MGNDDRVFGHYGIALSTAPCTPSTAVRWSRSLRSAGYTITINALRRSWAARSSVLHPRNQGPETTLVSIPFPLRFVSSPPQSYRGGHAEPNDRALFPLRAPESPPR